MSANRPIKTINAPLHWRQLSALPKYNTEQRTVKNFLVVVTTEQANGPKLATIRNINSWPKQPQVTNIAKCINSSGYLTAK